MTAEVRQHLPALSQPQAKVLAEWSYGVQAVQRCGQSQVSEFLAQVLGQKVDRVRQRLREWTWEQTAKKHGKNRREVPVSACFADLLHWVLSSLPAGETRVALALDATSLKQQFVVLTVSVLLKECAIPVAWQVLPAATPGAWRPYWVQLLTQVQAEVPADWQVLVLADRGLFADWLFAEIVARGWHPLLRINSQGLCCPEGASQFQPLLALVPASGTSWRGRVVCFVTTQLPATLLVTQAAEETQPWFILTDLAPEQAQAHWYAQRAWIEAQFKDLKRGGWQWHLTRMLHPERVSRLWLVLAVALLYSVSLGSQVETNRPAPVPAALPPTHVAHNTTRTRPAPRRLSLVSLGRIAFLATLILDQALPPIQFLGPNTCPGLT
jgi:hypothetical protein